VYGTRAALSRLVDVCVRRAADEVLAKFVQRSKAYEAKRCVKLASQCV
jgi:hypothetical protein